MATVESEAEVVDQAEVASEAATEDTGYTKREWDHYEAIRQKEREVRKAEGEYEARKEEANFAKKTFERLDKELRDMIARGPDPQMSLPLKADDAPVETWQNVPLSEVDGITEKQREKLAEIDLDTIGKVQAWVQAGNDLANIKGFGPEKAGKIADAIADWFKDHPESCGGVKAEPNQRAARIKLTRDIGDYANAEDGLYQHVEKDVMLEYANGACQIAIANGKSLVVSPSDFVVIEWVEAN